MAFIARVYEFYQTILKIINSVFLNRLEHICWSENTHLKYNLDMGLTKEMSW